MILNYINEFWLTQRVVYCVVNVHEHTQLFNQVDFHWNKFGNHYRCGYSKLTKWLENMALYTDTDA